MKLDDLLKDSLRGAPLSKDALERVRAAARSELKSGPVIPRWPTQLAVLLGSAVGVVALAGVVLLASGQTTAQVIASHGVQLLMLLAVAVSCGVSALRPNARGGTLAVALTLAAAASLVALRAEPLAPTLSPGWLCSVSHIGAGLLPLGVAAWLLRGSAPSLKKSVIAGIAVGCTGAMLGELGCEKGPLHIAIWHLGAWAVVIAAVVVVSRRLTPRSYAP